MKIKGSFTEAQFRQAVKKAAVKAAKMQTESVAEVKKCPDCYCHYTGIHTCPPWFRGVVKELSTKLSSKSMQNHPKLCKHTWVYICVDCGETVAPLVVPLSSKEPKPVPGRTNPLSPDYPHY